MDHHLDVRCALAMAVLAFAAEAIAASPSPAYQFTVPSGWSRIDRDGAIFLTPPAEPGVSAVLMILPPVARLHDLDAQFTTLRAGLEAGLKLRRPREATQERASGEEFEKRMHVATYSSDQGDRRVAVLARAEGRLVGTVLFMATSGAAYDRLRGVAANLFDGLRLVEAGAPRPVQAMTPPPAVEPAAAGWKGGGISGVWLALSSNWGLWTYANQPQWRIIYDDGVIVAILPDEGLAGFDRTAKRADRDWGGDNTWQTYTFSGSSGESRSDRSQARWPLKLLKPDQLKISNDTFYRCASVDGLRLHGAWTSHANPNDPQLDTLPIGRRPVIHFTRDGRFADDGLFATFLTSHGDDRPGAGRYELRDFTLFLHYDDGRERREAFTGLLRGNPAERDRIFYIRRGALVKRATP